MWRDLLIPLLVVVLMAAALLLIWLAFASKKRRRSDVSQAIGGVGSFVNTFFYKTGQAQLDPEEKPAATTSEPLRRDSDDPTDEA